MMTHSTFQKLYLTALVLLTLTTAVYGAIVLREERGGAPTSLSQTEIRIVGVQSDFLVGDTISLSYSVPEDIYKEYDPTTQIAQFLLLRPNGSVEGTILFDGRALDSEGVNRVEARVPSFLFKDEWEREGVVQWKSDYLLYNAGLDSVESITPGGEYHISFIVRDLVDNSDVPGDYPVDVYSSGMFVDEELILAQGVSGIFSLRLGTLSVAPDKDGPIPAEIEKRLFSTKLSGLSGITDKESAESVFDSCHPANFYRNHEWYEGLLEKAVVQITSVEVIDEELSTFCWAENTQTLVGFLSEGPSESDTIIRYNVSTEGWFTNSSIDEWLTWSSISVGSGGADEFWGPPEIAGKRQGRIIPLHFWGDKEGAIMVEYYAYDIGANEAIRIARVTMRDGASAEVQYFQQ